jgi:hypothetical protein
MRTWTRKISSCPIETEWESVVSSRPEWRRNDMSNRILTLGHLKTDPQNDSSNSCRHYRSDGAAPPVAEERLCGASSQRLGRKWQCGTYGEVSEGDKDEEDGEDRIVVNGWKKVWEGGRSCMVR